MSFIRIIVSEQNRISKTCLCDRFSTKKYKPVKFAFDLVVYDLNSSNMLNESFKYYQHKIS